MAFIHLWLYSFIVVLVVDFRIFSSVTMASGLFPDDFILMSSFLVEANVKSCSSILFPFSNR